MNRQSRRDMAMRRQDMRRSMLRDMRSKMANYRNRDREYYDNARGRRRDYEYGSDMRMDYARRDREMDYARRGRDRNMEYDMARGGYTERNDGHYPMMPYMDYGYDYAGSQKLSNEELKEWAEDLKEEIEPQYKHLYSKQNIEDVAKQMDIDFDKFTPMELEVVTLMMATDYAKSVGAVDINRNVAMAKEWLCDKDASVQYGEKLSAYYDAIVEGM